MSTRSRKSFNPKYTFASPEEIANRDADKGGFDPESNVPNFVQVRPANGGEDAAHPSGAQRRNGNSY